MVILQTPQVNNATPNIRHEPRPESNVNVASPVAPSGMKQISFN